MLVAVNKFDLIWFDLVGHIRFDPDTYVSVTILVGYLTIFHEHIWNHIRYIVFHFTSWHLTLGGIERSNQDHLVFIGLNIILSVLLNSGAVSPRGLLLVILFTALLQNVMDCFCIDADTRRGSYWKRGVRSQKKGMGLRTTWTPPPPPPLDPPLHTHRYVYYAPSHMDPGRTRYTPGRVSGDTGLYWYGYRVDTGMYRAGYRGQTSATGRYRCLPGWTF